MGMGLAISRTIVEAHGGRLSAENRNSGGVIFRLTIPVQQVRAAAADPLHPRQQTTLPAASPSRAGAGTAEPETTS